MSLTLRLLSCFRSFSAAESISKSSILIIRLLLVLLILSSVTNVFAQKTWLPATGGSWAAGANWSGGTIPLAGDVVIINSDQSGNITNVPTISLGGLTINGTCLFGSTAAGTAASLTVTGPLTIAAGETLTLGIDGSGFRVNLTLSATSVSTIAGTLNVTSGTVNRFLQNDGDLTITGTGNVRDNFSVTGFDSDFILGANATLRIGSINGITTSPTASGNIQVTGLRTFPTTADYVFVGAANQSTGNGLPATVNDLTIVNTGGGGNNTVSLTSSTGVSGTLSVNTGVFALGANNVTTVGALNMTGTSITGTGTLTLAGDVTTNASATASLISCPIGLGGSTRTFNVDDTAAVPDLNITGLISGAGGIVKSGIGSMNLSNASNSYVGSTTAAQGILRIAAAGGAIPNGSALIVNSTLDLNGNNETVGSLAGSGTITSNAGTTMTLTMGGDNTSTSFSGVIQNGSSTAVSISKTGTGALSLSGANTYSGSSTVLAGTLNINNATAIGSGQLIINGGNIDNTSGGLITLSNNNAQSWNSDFTFVGTQSLNLGTGAVTLSANRQVTVSASVLTVGGIIAGGAVSLSKLGAGTLTLSAANSYSGATFLLGGALNINNSSALGTGPFTIFSGTTIDNTSGAPITLSTNNAVNFNGDFTFTGTQNLNLGTGAFAFGSTRAITVAANTLTIGGNLNSGAFSLFKFGNGVLNFGANTITLNSLTISAGTLISTSGTLNIAGSISNSGTFTNNGGTVHYNGGTTQIINSLSYNNLTLSGAGQKNASSSISVAGNLINASTLDMGSNILSVTGTITNAGGDIRFSGPTNGIAIGTGTITYNGASQTITSGIYNNLTINQSAGEASLSGAVTVNGILTLTAGNLNLNGHNLTLGPSASISVASPSSTRMIIATGGSQIIKTFSALGSFLFPIGDNTGTVEYSPITVNITAGSGFPANIGVSVVDAKHPSNVSTTNFLSRFWEITQPGITGCVATVTGTYTAADVTGAEGSISSAQVSGTFNQSTNAWAKFSALGGNTFTATGASLALGQTHAFTGITGSNPVATINIGAGVTICIGNSVNLNTSATGDPSFTYSWSSVPVAGGLSANNIANPIATPTATTVYTVTIRDGNGIIDTENTTITVNPLPAAPSISTSGSTVCDGANPDVTLTSSAAPNGGTYVWYKGGIATGDVGGSLIINDPAESGLYSVTVIDGITFCVSPQSPSETVTINALPLITPVVTPATTTICSGSTVTVNIAGSQAGINYELFDGGTSLSTAIAGTGGAINLITSALSANTTITVRATNPTTTCTVLLSGTSVVTVTPIPTTPTVTPAGPVVVCEGSANITLTSDAGAGNQWYKDGLPIGGATATTFNITTAPANSGSYTVISTVSGCASAVSNAVAVTINALPLTTPVVTPATTTICSGSTVTVNIAGSQAGINYELFDGGTSLSTAIAGTGGAINLITSALSANTTITVRATNPTTTCTVLLSGTSVVTVTPIPTTPTVTPAGPVVVCEGSANITLTSDAGAGNQWYKDGLPIGGATATTFNITTAPANSGSYTVISTVSGCASAVSNAVAVTINALPLTTPVVTPATTTICSGSTVTVNIAGSQAGINYELFDGGTSLSTAIAGTGGAINLITSALSANTTITVRATNPTTTCTVLLSGTSVVTVTPIPTTPTVTPAGPVVVCEGSANITLTSDAGAGNQWYKDGLPIGGATATTFNITTAPANSGSYTVISTVSGCASAVSNAVAVTINALPLTTPVVTPATTTICSGSTVTVNIAGSQAGINYELFDGGTSLSTAIAGTGGAINLITSALSANITITVRATNPTTTCTVLLSGTSVVTVTPIPTTPTVTPAGPVVVCEGSANITLTSDAGAGNQWYKDGLPIGGATATTFNITTAPANSGSYTVISTVSGCASAVSNAVAVTINALPLTTPVVTPATTTICSGSTVTVNIAGSQAGINYELFDGGTSLSTAIAGTGGAINLITSALSANTTITVRATNPTTTCTVLLSGTSVVTVTPIPTTPTVTPAGPVVVCEGSANITLTSDAGAGNQWYKDGLPIGGATATTFNITTAPANSGSYTVISTVSGCASAVSNAVAVTINALPLTTPVVTPATTTICSGSTVTVNIAGSQAGINYELFDGGTSLSTAIAGTGGAINLITSALSANITITVRATNPTTTCTVLLSGTSVVTVTPIPTTPTVTPAGPVVVCEGSANITLTSDAGAGNQWYKDGLPIGGATATTFNITTAPANSGSYTVISTVSGCASAVSNAVAVTINALPLTTPVVTPATTTICSGSTVTVNIAGSQAGINYELFDGGTSLSTAIAGTGGAINLITSALSANTTITVRATNPTTTCTVLLSGTSVVTVTPIPTTPTVTPAGPVVVCEGSANITLTSDAGAGNQWYKDGLPIGGATATTFNITTAPANSGSYTVISTVSGCASAVSNAVAVTINALPLTTPVVTPATTTICSGSTVTVNIAGSQAGINYELFDGGTSLSTAIAGTGGAINLITSALSANTTITVRATNPTTTCTVLLNGTSVVTVTPIPTTPTVTPAGPVVVCEGSANITLTSDAGAGNQWYKDGLPIGGATATTFNITTAPANSGSYTVISTVSGCASAVSNAVAVTINALPLTTPVVTPATTTICSGSTVTVNIAGSQAGINYELFDGGTSLSTAIAGTGGAINLITSALSANITITVRATNPTTTCTVLLSGTSVVTVTPIPTTPTVTPAGPVVVCEGSANITLTSDAGAGNQWYKDGLPIGGATATTFNITTAPANSGSYTVISTVSGCASAVSNAVAVTINALPLTTPVVTPATTTICSGSTVTVNIAGSQAGINYELFDGGTSLSTAIAGTGGAINLITSALSANTTITVRATNPTTTCTVLLNGTSVVTVTPIPTTPTVTPAGPVVVCEGSANITLTSDAGAGNQWYKDGLPIGGATATTFNITTAPANSGSYTVISTVSGCASAVSNAVAVTINALPLTTPVVTPATTTICSGSTVTVNIAGSQAGINYELFDGGTSLSTAIAGTGGAINLITSALSANTTITVRATNPTTTCTVLLSGTSVVTVTPIPTTPTVTPAGPVVVCEGSANITLTSDAGAGNQWYKDGLPIGGATATTFNITTAPANSGSYTVISTVSGCASAVSNAVAVTINALPLTTPVVTPATTTICSGSTVTVNIAGSQAGINYELFDGGTSLSTAIAGTGGAINLITSALSANTTITVRATNPTTTCTVLLSGTSVVTVTPIPTTPTVTPAGPVVVCEGSANITLTSDAGAGNQWYKDGLPIGGATATTFNITTAPANSGSYTVISTVSGCASAVSNAVAVTINALPLTTPVVTPATTTICSGSTVTVNIAGSQAGINYELFDGGTSLSTAIAGTGGAINLITSALSANITITVRATNPTTTCTVLLSGTSVVTVTPIPTTPTVTPAGPVVVCEGSANITLTSDAGAGNQWYKDGLPIGGATATTFNITTAPANSGSYTVISTVSGCASAVSNAVAVTINALPLSSPGVSPVSTIICSGSSVTVSVTGTETGINYQLFDGPTPISSVVAGTGGMISLISSALTVSTTVTVAAVNPITGCGIVLPGTITVTLSATIPTPTIAPVGPLTACVGDPVITLTSSAASGNQWYKDGVIIAGATNPTLNISTGVINSGSYTVIETQAGCTSATSVGVNVTINSIASPPVASNPTPICVGGTIPTLVATGTNLQWYSDAALTSLVGTGSPFTPSSTEVDNTIAGTYTLYVTQTIGCESVATNVDVLVNPAVSVNAGADTNLCAGQSITLGGSPTANGGSGTYTYSWTSIPPGFTSSQSNPLVTPALGTITYVLQVTDAFGCLGTGQVDITVNEVPTFSITNNTGGGTGQICSGSSINIALTSPTAGATITLQNVSYGVVTGGAHAAGGSFVSGNTITESGGLINGSNVPVTVNYVFSVSTPDCNNPVTQQASVIVNPAPVMSTINATTQICSNSAVDITLNSPTSGAVIELTSVVYGGVTGTLAAGATFTPGSKITETLINFTNAAITIRYNFDVVANGCVNSGSFVDVIVNPNPTFIASNFSTEICSGDQTNILFGSATPGHQINVVSVNYGFTTGGTVNPGVTIFNSATPLIETLLNNTNSAIDVVYEFNVTTPATTPVCSLSPVSQFVTVRVNPAPTFVVTNNTGGGSGIICSGNQTNILLNTPVSGGQIRLVDVIYGSVSGTLTDGALFSNGQIINEVLINTTTAPVIVSYEFEAIVGVCGPSLSQIVTVEVRPLANVVALPASQTICSGSNTSIALSTTNGVGGATYSWTVAQNNVSGATASSGATINQTLMATTSSAGTATYTITPNAGGCNGAPIVVIVTVNPLPDVIAAPNVETICSGATTNISLSTSNGVAGATYSWTVVQSNVSGATAGFGTSINQTLTATTSAAGTATYTITPSSNGCNGTAIVVVVTVNPTPNVVALPASQTICSGSNTSIALSTTNGVGGATYSWTVAQNNVSGATASSGATINQTLMATTSSAGTATYTITPNAGGCNGAPIVVIVTVNPLPDVIAAPNVETICSGATTNISLSTSNGVAGATYSWTVVQSNVSGATAGFGTSINQTLTATTSAAGTATYTITPSSNGCNGTAIVVVVTVNPTPNVVALPASQTICSGANTSIALSTTNGVGGATYSWTVAQNNVSGATASSGATINQTLMATTSSAGTATYTITPNAGGCNGAPIVVIVTVNPLPDVIAAPNVETICSGATTNISLSTSNGVAGATYSWTVVQSNVSGATTGFGTSINQTLTATTSAAGTATYTITPSSNGCNGTAIVVVVTVNPTPNVVALPASQTICSGSNTSIALSTTNGVGGATYSWTVVQNNVSGATASSGATINQTLMATTSSAGTATYTITPNAGGCNGAPIVVIVTVNPLPDVIAAPNVETICSGATTNISLSTSNGVAGATYSWTVVQSNVSGATAGFGTSINQTLTATTSAAGTATYTITPSSNGCNGTAIVVVVTVNPTPNVVALPASQTICSGANTSIALSTTNGVGGATYSWTVAQNNVSGATASSGATINQTLMATTSSAGTATYTITPNAGGCNGAPIVVIVTVNPLPDVIAAPNVETICSGATTNISLSTSNGVAGATYSWTVVQSNVSGATTGFGTSINQTLTATTSAAGTATYTITPSSNGCNGTAIVVVVTVNPTPNVVALPASQTICSGSNTSIALSTTNGVGGATYSWTVVQNNVSGATASSGATINQTLMATTSSAGTATYTITPNAGGCNGAPIVVIVTVNPLPDVIAAPNVETICSGATTNISLSTSNGVAGATYSWTVVQSNVSGATAGFGTSINQTLTATTSAAGTATYTITPSSNGCNGTAIVVVVTVNPTPNVVALPASQTICSGANTSIALSTTNGVGGATYSWTVAQNNVSGATASSGATINQTLMATTSSAGTATYTITPNAGGCNGAPIVVIVTVNPLPDVIAAPNVETICSGATTNISLSTSNGVAGATYSWTVVQSNVSGATAGFGTSINQTLTATTSAAGTATYTITPSSNGCNGTAIVVVVTVNPAPLVLSTPLAITRCSAVGPINFTPTFTVAGTTYTWTSSVAGPITVASVTASGSATIIDNPINTGSISGTIIYTFVPTAPGSCVGPTFNYVVTVNPEPVGVNDAKTVCSDAPVAYSLLLNVSSLGNNVGSTFVWVAADNVNPLVTGESISSTAGPSITDILVNKTNTDQAVVYTITPTSTNGCLGGSFQITVTVKPEPVGVSVTAPDICSGSLVAYDLQGNVNALGNVLASNFTWTALSHPDVTGETTSLKSGSVIDDMLVNNSGVNQTVTYLVTPTSQVGGCLGDPFTILVNVNPKAIFTAGPDLAVCVDQNDIEIQGLVTFAPATYSWSGGTGTFDNNTLEKPRYILSAADKAVVVPTVRVLTLTIAASGVCPAEVETVNLTLNPLPNASFIGLPFPAAAPENGADITLNAFQAGGLFTVTPGSGLTATTIDPGTGFDQTFLTPANATLYDGTPATLNVITYTFTNVNGCTNSTSQSLRVNPLTNVDFTVANSTLDGDGDYRVCADTGDLLLSPIVPSGPPGISRVFVSYSPSLPVIFDGTNYFIRTTNAPSGVYTIEFQFVNSSGVPSSKPRDIKVQASPVVSFTSTGTCIDSPTTFTNTSTINLSNVNSPFAPTIGLVEWNFGDFSGVTGAPAAAIPLGTNAGRTTGTYDNPSHTYGNASSFTVSLKVTTTQGCASTYTSPTSVIVGTIPLVDFDYFAICNNDSTRFKAVITNLGSSTIAQYSWNFDDGDLLSGLGTIAPPANSGRTIGTYDEPIHKYVSTGGYDPTLTVTTNLGCTSLPRTRPITIVPYVTVVASSANPPESFNTPAGWFIENLIDPDDNTFVSWKHGAPTGTEITTANSAGNVWWSGNNVGNTYFSNEKSAVNSPCFDLDALERPMIALDYFSDLESNLDGVVLQYSIDGGATWELVGPALTETRDQGINWFNGQGIPSNPGNQLVGQYGWTDEQRSWKNARFNLDRITKTNGERKQVRFRLALASNSTNAPGIDFDGFAFDNVYVGEKQRNVLIEHFTTTQLTASVNADNYLNGLYQTQLINRGYSDFQQIQYHVNFSGTDPFNKDNPTDPAARALYFGASQPPYTIMDGVLVPGKFTGNTYELNNIEIDRRALVDPVFNLTLKDTTSIDNKKISVKMVITANRDFTSPLIMNVALVEKDATGFKNVLRKNLFGSDGETINLTWVNGQQLIKLKFDVPIDVPITNPNQLLLIGYVQDKNTKEIYQSIAIDGPIKLGDPVVGVLDEPILAALNSIQMFPNPANQEFTFGLPADVHAGSQWRIIDQRGITVLEGDFEGVVNGMKQVNVSGLANEIYFVIMTGPKGVTVRKKLVVMNRN